MSILQIISAVMLTIAAAGLAVAVFYVRAGLRSQRAALATLNEVRATYVELASRLRGVDDVPSWGRHGAGARLSLKCRIYGDRPHWPCSGTTDDGDEVPCECWCHVIVGAPAAGM